jgi:GPH family glycoside/pentoside/hexuronide:cation symporter
VIAAALPGVLVSIVGMSERAAFAAIGAAFSIALTASCLLLAVRVRESVATSPSAPRTPFVPGVRRALRNRPFRILLTSYVVGSAASAIPGTLMPFFTAYVIRPDNHAGWLAAFRRVLRRGLPVPAGMDVGRAPLREEADLAREFLFGITGGASILLPRSRRHAAHAVPDRLVGRVVRRGLFLSLDPGPDVIDYDELHTGKRREAQYTSFWAMLPKFVAIPSAAIPIAVVGTLGYVPNVNERRRWCSRSRRSSRWPLVLARVPRGAALSDRRAHPRAHRLGIEAHANGQAAIDPLTGDVVLPASSRAVDEHRLVLDHLRAVNCELPRAR